MPSCHTVSPVDGHVLELSDVVLGLLSEANMSKIEELPIKHLVVRPIRVSASSLILDLLRR